MTMRFLFQILFVGLTFFIILSPTAAAWFLLWRDMSLNPWHYVGWGLYVIFDIAGGAAIMTRLYDHI